MQKDRDGEEEEEEDEEYIREKLLSVWHLRSSLVNAAHGRRHSRSHVQLPKGMLAWACEEGALTGG